ncbi:hypothetical protein ACNHUS_33460 [Actinomycetes bacterium M1A6_2h]
MTASQLTALAVDQSSPLALPLLRELAVEYSSRYGGTAEQLLTELSGYTPLFDPATEPTEGVPRAFEKTMGVSE